MDMEKCIMTQYILNKELASFSERLDVRKRGIRFDSKVFCSGNPEGWSCYQLGWRRVKGDKFGAGIRSSVLNMLRHLLGIRVEDE